MTEHNNADKRLFLLDAYALIYRSYFAFIKNPRFNSKGLNTSAMLGFVNVLEQLLKDQKPTHIAVVFDLNVPTFRHEMFEAYKATREAMPEDLIKSIPYIRNIIEAYHIPILEKAGFEADDVIGTLAKKAETMGYTTYMMTPDKDYAQLVSENIFMYKPSKGGEQPEVWGIPEVRVNFEVEEPWQVIDILGLMGDTSDNIPGCPGIGPKTAMKLISTYKSIEGLYENIHDLKGKMKDNLVEFEEQVRLSRVLAKIILDVPVEFDENKLIMEEPNWKKLNEIFSDLEFRQLIRKQETAVQTPVDAMFKQGTLFGGPLSSTEVHAPEIIAPATVIKNLDSFSTVQHQYYLIETAAQRASLRAELSVQKEFCFDTETTGLDTQTAELVCMSFAFRSHEAFCVTLPADRKEATKVVQEFQLVFGDENITKIGQNIKYDLSMLLNYGVELKGPLFDTMMAHYLIQPEMRHNLDYLCELYLGYEKITTETLIGKKGALQQNMRQAPLDKLRDYSCEDADLTLQLKLAIEKDLDESGTRQLFDEIEMPLIYVLADMERAGVKLNTGELKLYAGILNTQLISIEKEIIDLAGEEFNISSPKQLGVILFEKLNIDPNAKMTKTKQYSTAEETLEKLQHKHPIISKILEFRGLKKLLSTYVEALPLLINPNTGKLHTSYNQAIAATGRLSSTNPNLQNIPIRDENGRELRKAFIPSDSEHTFLSADYSQIELRIMAALSQDKQMIEAFRNNQDIHSITASKIYKIPLSEVTSDMRRKAKTANFGIIYGISSHGLSARLNIPKSEATKLIVGYFENFADVKAYMDQSIEKARNVGFVETIMGRKRYLSDINSANSMVRGMAERNAINAPIQGSAADVIKIAMVNIWRAINQQKLQSKMILQVHDELNFDVLIPELEQMTALVKQEMENAVNIGVPLTVEINAGDNWLDAH
ncbi:MAG TPA: DNA polymerase I [Prolixibacteraceae bacterium]|jgi:DNA polymerase-1|nr:DNA polymerase I [Prolixibacteraceae bacterium]